MYRSKVLGMLVGGAIGDALGMPVETWTSERIREVHAGGVRRYESPIEHKWFTGDPNDKSLRYMPAGTITDDTQLTIATVRGLIEGHKKVLADGDFKGWFKPYMDSIAAEHVKAKNASTAGWGKSTVEAVERLEAGCCWSQSGKTDNPHRGTGNGVPMKCSPLAVWGLCDIAKVQHEGLRCVNFQHVVHFSAMTHYTKISAEAAVIHTAAIESLLNTADAGTFHSKTFCDLIADGVFEWQQEDNPNYWNVDALNESEDNLRKRLWLLSHLCLTGEIEDLGIDDMRYEFGSGSCYVYDSLPFAYAWFLRDPHSFQSILDTVNAGGDTDTNAKLVGEMIGALHGIEFFHEEENLWSIAELPCEGELIDLGNELCDVLGID